MISHKIKTTRRVSGGTSGGRSEMLGANRSTKMSLEKRLAVVRKEYEDTEEALQKLVTSLQKLEAQHRENLAVKKEFESLTPNNAVYKLMGQVLVRQDQNDAKENVSKRLEFINDQIKQVEISIKAQQDTAEQKKIELVQIQTQLSQPAK